MIIPWSQPASWRIAPGGPPEACLGRCPLKQRSRRKNPLSLDEWLQLVTGKDRKMCITPTTLPSGSVVPCRNCWQCRKDRVDDWIGRCIAESQFSTKVYSVTLTYREGTPNSATLVYSDVQKFLKLLRFDQYKVRYFCAGEYGTKKGRAHCAYNTVF